jgi:TetR/AcrR family transcriptional regulator, transcriptional repressor for nem operon
MLLERLDDGHHLYQMMRIIQAMRHSEAEKQRSHDRIVEVAARRIREAGTDGPGVAEIMAAAGMTHGGFYKHFGSRDELVETYLSAGHRDDPGTGCAVAALGGDVARPGNAARPAYTEQVRRYIDRLQSLLPQDGSPAQRRERAIATMSTLIGGLVIARAVDDPSLSDEVLAATRDALLAGS